MYNDRFLSRDSFSTPHSPSQFLELKYIENNSSGMSFCLCVCIYVCTSGPTWFSFTVKHLISPGKVCNNFERGCLLNPPRELSQEKNHNPPLPKCIWAFPIVFIYIIMAYWQSRNFLVLHININIVLIPDGAYTNTINQLFIYPFIFINIIDVIMLLSPVTIIHIRLRNRFISS